ncbi:MAG TPA: ATP-binding protein [Burkholderiaceae bacterium]|nr:ATP-binding protein [Burkholderiaceae bacterium]
MKAGPPLAVARRFRIGGRLFWKFFLAFWVALLIAAGAVAGAVYVYQQNQERRASQVEQGPRADFRVGAAANVLIHGGTDALKAFLREEDSPPRTPILAVDAQGHDLLGRIVPPVALANARALAHDGRARAVREVGQGSGRLLLFEPARFDSAEMREPRPLPADPDAAQARTFGDWAGKMRPPPPAPQQRPPLSVAVAIGIIASLAFAAALAWYFARPIRALDWALRSATQGKLDVRVRPLIGGRRDEIADLGRQFDQMVQQVQAMIASQRQLFHDVSHELRSPLARMEAALGLARQSPERVEASLERIERESRRLDALVGEVLTLARLDSGVDDEAPQPTDLAALLASVVDDARFEGERIGVEVSCDAPARLPIRARADDLLRAFDNIVRNALRFAPRGSTIDIALRTSDDGKRAILTVDDKGPGLQPDELDTVFRPFVRANGGSNGTGFGLGLAIAERAVRAHDGTIEASNRPAGGLRIAITLPLTA